MEIFDTVLWGSSLRDWAVFVLVQVGVVLVGLWLSRWLKRTVLARADKTENRLDDVLAGIGCGPSVWLMLLIGLSWGFEQLALPKALGSFLKPAFVISWTFVVALLVMRLSRGLISHYVQRYAEASDQQLFSEVVRLMRSVLSVLVCALVCALGFVLVFVLVFVLASVLVLVFVTVLKTRPLDFMCHDSRT